MLKSVILAVLQTEAGGSEGQWLPGQLTETVIKVKDETIYLEAYVYNPVLGRQRQGIVSSRSAWAT